MNIDSQYLKVFSEIIPIKGYRRSLIYDLIRSDLTFIPNTLVDFLNESENKSLNEIFKILSSKEKIIANKYLNLLKKNEYIFFCDKDETQLFQKMGLAWDYPAKISSSIIKLKSFDTAYLKKTIGLVSSTLCKNVLLILDFKIDTDQLEECYLLFKETGITNLEFVLLNKIIFDRISFSNFLVHSKRLTKITLSQDIQELKIDKISTRIIFAPKLNTDQDKIEKSIYDFLICIPFFTESQHHNTYFNRKIYFEHDEFVKNSPESLTKHPYPNNTFELNSIISSSAFKEFWDVKKDDCNVCKDCEFRHMCLDNRLPYQGREGSWYHKTECNYNPYIAKWKGEEGYRTLAECGVISNHEEFSIDHEKIAAINEELWGEE